mgnify:FL=1
MKKLLETLYITTPESYLFERNGNICISIGGTEKASVPISQVDSIVLFGKNTLSTALLSFCSKNDVTITFLSENGFFQGRVCGPVSGNVLLRKRQYESLSEPEFVNRFVTDLLFCKIRNSKSVLLRYARSTFDETAKRSLAAAISELTEIAQKLDVCSDIASMRGIEGAAASVYFSRFDALLSSPKGYRFEVRSHRPPMNEVNAVLSFVYTLLAHDVRASIESVGLDPAAGYLHTLRPGRSSFALDLIEELRAPLCDRLVISMFNKNQFQGQDFTTDFGAVYLSDRGRRKVLEQWRSRKRESIQHPFLKEKISIGMIPYAQSMLFARVLRGDLDRYPPFVWR